MIIKNHSRICIMISVAIIAVALLMSLFGAGVNLGIDFTGGLNITYDMSQAFDQADVTAALEAQGITVYSVAYSGAEGNILQIRIPEVGSDAEIHSLQSGLETALIEKYPNLNKETATASYVGPIAGAALVRNAILSVLLANVLMLVYIAFRFDLYSGIAAVIGLVHDVLMMLSAMVILRSFIQMNSSFIAAMLTIVGYSINNTIVIFDRIRENNTTPSYKALSRVEVVNVSISQSLGRTIFTSLTSVTTIAVLYIMGVDSIREFSLPIIVGIFSSIYSANMINGYVWAFLEDRNIGKKKAKLKTKKA